MKYTLTILTAFALVFTAAAPASARSNRVNQMPNGSDFGCDICHTAANGLNDFGFDSFDYTSGGNVAWGPEFAAKDSDRDGYSNGVELGDPNGTWRIGQNDPSGMTSDPGNKEDNSCGNGSLEASEECEGSDLQGETCDSLGLGGGTLRCGTTCGYDVSGCGSCGDQMAQPAEDCDGGDTKGATCEMLGYTGGLLTCNSACDFDVTSCDGSTGEGYSVCGDGLATGPEGCDTFDLKAQTCQSLGFEGGTLECAGTCVYNTARCEGPSPDDLPSVDDGPADAGISAGTQTQTQTNPNPNHIEFEGHACSATGYGRTAGWFPVLLLVGMGLFWRRRDA